jgi:hypothetical protein
MQVLKRNKKNYEAESESWINIPTEYSLSFFIVAARVCMCECVCCLCRSVAVRNYKTAF